MITRCQPRASGRAVWVAILALAVCSIPVTATAADPFADSFASGGKKQPAHRVTTRKKPARPAKRPKPARPAHGKAHGKPRPFKHAPPPSSRDDGFAAPAETAQPQREEPSREEPQREEPTREEADESPRARRAAESEEAPRAEEEEDRPKPRRAAPAHRSAAKKRKHGTDDDSDSSSDEDDEATPYAAPTATRPVIVPRTFALLLGGTMMGRSFRFDAPLQRESSFPRIGYQAGIETYPLRLLGDTWMAGFGLAASYAAEGIGKASVTQPNGMSSSTSVKQSRWNLDLRYAFELGGYVVLAPDVGLANSSFTLNTDMPVMASQCAPTATTACVPDTDALLLQTGVHLRFAVTKEIGITLDGAYLQALSVKNKPLNQIGYEAGTSANGFDTALGATYLLTDFLSVHAEVPFTRLTYTFHNPPDTPYKTATETYYGLTLAVSVFTD